jgi:hypothetical protein
MSVHNYKSGLGSVGSYQVSGKPWITGSTVAAGAEHHIQFPSVAKAVTIINTDPTGNDDIRIHFNSKTAGNVISGNHYITLANARDSLTLTTKCIEIYISNPSASPSAYQMIAELTGIGTTEMFVLTGSGLTD